MEKSTWIRIKEIFDRLADLSEQDRETELLKIELEQPQLIQEVRALLAEDRTGGPLQAFATRHEHFMRDWDERSSVWAGAKIGTFRLVKCIGRGGMGVVYEAMQDTPKRRVAVKTLKQGLYGEDEVRRFRYEAEIMAKLVHPGIAQIYEVGTWTPPGSEQEIQLPYIAMELIEGGVDLCTWATEQELGVKGRIELFLQVCDAVQFGHQKGVVHRDIKRSNVLVDRTGKVKVIDFGIALTLETWGPAAERLTQEGQIVGTLANMSPEQLDGRRDEVDTRSDVYSLGILLYELLTGRHPFSSPNQSIQTLILRIHNETPERPTAIQPNLSAELDWISERALEKEPDLRYATAVDLAHELRRFLADQPLAAGPPSTMYRLRKFVRRNRILVGSAFAVLLAILVSGVLTALALADARRGWAAEAIKSDLAEARKTEAEAALSRARWSSNFIRDIFRSAMPTQTGSDARVLDFLDQARNRLEQQQNPNAEREWATRFVLGTLYRNLRQFRPAEVLLERAYDLAISNEHLRLDEKVEVGAALVRLRFDLGQESAAEVLLEEIRGLLEEQASKGPIDENLGQSMADLELDYRQYLAIATAKSGSCMGGIKAMKAVIEAKVERYGEDSMPVINSRFNFAGMLSQCGQAEKAIEIQRSVLLSLLGKLGAENSITLGAMTNLAVLIARTKTHSAAEEALGLLQEVTSISSRLYGTEDPRVLVPKVSMLGILCQLGRYEEADSLAHGLATACRRALGESSTHTLHAYHNTSVLATYHGDYEKALDMAEEALRLAEKSSGSKSLVLINSLDAVGGCLLSLNRPAEAADYYQRALEIAASAGLQDISRQVTALCRALTRMGMDDYAAQVRQQYGGEE